jgi:hypothetical protein
MYFSVDSFDPRDCIEFVINMSREDFIDWLRSYVELHSYYVLPDPEFHRLFGEEPFEPVPLSSDVKIHEVVTGEIDAIIPAPDSDWHSVGLAFRLVEITSGQTSVKACWDINYESYGISIIEELMSDFPNTLTNIKRDGLVAAYESWINWVSSSFKENTYPLIFPIQIIVPLPIKEIDEAIRLYLSTNLGSLKSTTNWMVHDARQEIRSSSAIRYELSYRTEENVPTTPNNRNNGFEALGYIEIEPRGSFLTNLRIESTNVDSSPMDYLIKDFFQQWLPNMPELPQLELRGKKFPLSLFLSHLQAFSDFNGDNQVDRR